MPSVLLLNADAQPLSLLPLSTISWQNAIKAFYQDKVDILKTYEGKVIRSAKLEFPMPSVVMLKHYQKRPTRAKFTRRNMYIRDNFTCQYCGEGFDSSELTIDHVVPRSKGGKTSWTNCASACKKCNTKKDSKLIKPINEPVAPSWHHINNSKHFKLRISDPAWQEFIQWPEDRIEVRYFEEVSHVIPLS